ncbi:MAG: Crp/Fnr family transcriptional regulator [Thermodesulfobacteriota bacterium]|nr:Crp/Fnr family transcriptional regulator [Thermodesulfobacteriota bacterium]
MDTLEFLSSVPLARGLSKEQLKTLASFTRKKKYRAKQLIIAENDKIREFYMIARGRVKMFKNSIDGREQTLHLFGPGELFGMCATSSDFIFPANAMALEQSTLLIFPVDMIEALGRKDPTILFNMISVLSCMLKDSMAMIETLSLMRIPQRVASFLLLSTPEKACSKGDNMELAVNQKEIAKILGTTPETLSRILKKMMVEHIIEVKGKHIKVLDCESLEELASV